MVQGWRAKDPMKSTCCKTQLFGSPQGPGWAAGRTGGHSAAWPDPAGASGDAAADRKGGGCRGGRSKQAKAQGTPPRKCCALTPTAAGTNTQFQAWKEPDDQPEKKHLTKSLLYFAIFFLICCSTAAEALQNCFA